FTPSCSPGRGGRVVADTERRNGGSLSAKSRAITVDFPLPLGPDRIISGPSVIGAVRVPVNEARPLLYVLNQFADLLESAFDLDHVPRDFHVAGLGPDGVGLAEHLLGQEFQLPARAVRVVHDLLKLIEVAGQPHHLLGDVAALGEDGDLLDKITTV